MSTTDLIPYSQESRQIVLRHKDAVVVFDERSKELSASQPTPGEPGKCPYCQRPYTLAAEVGNKPAEDDASFVSPQYFRRLAASRSGSRQPSRPLTPHRRLRNAPTPSPGNGEQARTTSPVPEEPHRIASSAFLPDYFARFFVEERELGRGGRGVVLLVRHILDGVPLGMFACKRIPVGDNHEWLENVLMEVSMLQNISHENLVSYQHVWLENFKPTTFAPSSPHVFILQKFCNGGTLLDYVLGPKQHPLGKEGLKNRARRFSKGDTERMDSPRRPKWMGLEEVFAFFRDITRGLAYLHAQGYVHRDLKPQNCLLHTTGNTTKVLVSDFGEMQGSSMSRKANATGYTGTVSFAAPEVVTRDATGKYGDFTPKSDVFSLGMIVYFMCFGRVPYPNADLEEEREDLAELRNEVMNWTGLKDERQERPDLPEKLYLYLQLLLSPNPDDRPSTEDILLGIRTGVVSSDGAPSSPILDDGEPRDNPFKDTPSNTNNKGSADELRRRGPRTKRPDSMHERASSAASNSRSLSPPYAPASSENTADASGHDIVPVAHTAPAAALLPRRQSLLLPPPRSRWQIAADYAASDEFAGYLRIVIFVTKMWSLYTVCTPLVPVPVYFYPLVLAATWDVAQSGHSFGSTAVLALAHLVTLSLATRFEGICPAEYDALAEMLMGDD